MSDLHYFAIFRVKIGVKGQNIDFLRSNLVRKLFSSIWLKFSPEKLLRSKNPLARSDLHYFAIFRVKIGVKGQNIDFFRSNLVRTFSLIWFTFLSEKLLRSRNSLVKSDLHYFAFFRIKTVFRNEIMTSNLVRQSFCSE